MVVIKVVRDPFLLLGLPVVALALLGPYLGKVLRLVQARLVLLAVFVAALERNGLAPDTSILLLIYYHDCLINFLFPELGFRETVDDCPPRNKVFI